MPRKGKNLYIRKDGRLKGRHVKGCSGERIQYGYVYGKTHSDVKKIVTIKRGKAAFEHNNISAQQVQSKTFSNIAEIWISEAKSRLKESTVAKYQNLLNKYVLPIIGEEMITAIDYACISQVCTRLNSCGGTSKQGLSDKTVCDVLSIIKAIIKYAGRMKYPIDRSALDVTVKLKKQHLRFFSRQEQTILLNYLVKSGSLIDIGVLICLFTGIRIGEICALTWGDISTADKTMFIHRAMQRIQSNECGRKTKILISEPKSSCSVRSIPLPDVLLDWLPRPSVNDAYVLTGKVDRFIEPRTMQNHFKKVLQICQIDNATFHTIRHTFATRCIEVGFDIKSLSEILGHANVNITLDRYVHPSMELKQENIAKLSQLFTVK